MVVHREANTFLIVLLLYCFCICIRQKYSLLPAISDPSIVRLNFYHIKKNVPLLLLKVNILLYCGTVRVNLLEEVRTSTREKITDSRIQLLLFKIWFRVTKPSYVTSEVFSQYIDSISLNLSTSLVCMINKWPSQLPEKVKPNRKLLLTIFTARQRSCRKVMFSVVSVHHSIYIVTRDLETITHNALDLIVQGPFLVQGPAPLISVQGPC